MITLKRTNKRKILYPYILGKPFKPFNLGYNLRIIKFNKLVKEYRELHILLKDGWYLNYESAELMAREYLEWKHYLPLFSLKGKVVLDIGAGCGETARYFLLNGAERVICVDNNIECINYLEKNSEHFNITVIPYDFDIRMLFDIDYDYCKIDIEGYEALIINDCEREYFNPNNLKPTVIECHSQYSINKFREMGFRVIHEYRGDLKMMCNWLNGGE